MEGTLCRAQAHVLLTACAAGALRSACAGRRVQSIPTPRGGGGDPGPPRGGGGARDTTEHGRGPPTPQRAGKDPKLTGHGKDAGPDPNGAGGAECRRGRVLGSQADAAQRPHAGRRRPRSRPAVGTREATGSPRLREGLSPKPAETRRRPAGPGTDGARNRRSPEPAEPDQPPPTRKRGPGRSRPPEARVSVVRALGAEGCGSAHVARGPRGPQGERAAPL